MKRYRHVMASTKGNRQPAAIVSVACETTQHDVEDKPGYQRLHLVRWHTVSTKLINGRPEHVHRATGTTPDTWWRSLDRLLVGGGTIVIVSASAVTDWSLLGLWEALEEGRVWCCGRDRNSSGERDTGAPISGYGYLVIEDTPSIALLSVRDAKVSLKWVDIGNYGIDPLNLPMDICEMADELHRIICAIVNTLTDRRWGQLRDTVGSQAMYSFRRKHLRNLIVCHTVKPVLDMERASYYGGRVECGRIGKTEGPIYELDIRGSYLSVCTDTDLPVRLVAYNLTPAAGEVPDNRDRRGFAACVTIETDRPCYPVGGENGVYWPVGRYATTLAGPELAHAEKAGRVISYHSWAEYDLEPCLTRWAEDVYDLRCECEESGDTALATWAKGLAVSLAGKLGQRSRQWVWEPRKKPRNYYDQYYGRHTDGAVHRYQEIAGRHRREDETGWAPDAVPAIAAWITSEARMRLWALMECAHVSECWYVATDCLYVSAEGYSRLTAAGWIREGELGYLQVKGVHPWIDVRGLNSYAFPDRDVEAGRPRTGTYWCDDEPSCYHSVWIATLLEAGERPSAQRHATTHEHVAPYTRGIVTAGGRVEPLQLWES